MFRLAFLYFWRRQSGQTLLNYPKLLIALVLFFGISSLFYFGIRGKWGGTDNFGQQMEGMEDYWDTRTHLKTVNKAMVKYLADKGKFPATYSTLEDEGYCQTSYEMNREWDFYIEGSGETALLIAASTQYNERGGGKKIVFDRSSGKFIE